MKHTRTLVGAGVFGLLTLGGVGIAQAATSDPTDPTVTTEAPASEATVSEEPTSEDTVSEDTVTEDTVTEETPADAPADTTGEPAGRGGRGPGGCEDDAAGESEPDAATSDDAAETTTGS